MTTKLYPTNRKKQNNDCPSCGFHISYTSTFESVLAGDFNNDRNGSYTATRITPIRSSTVEADVIVPVAQSAIWSLVAILPSIPVMFWLRYEWYFPFAIGSLSLLASWASSMKRSEAMQSKVEEFSYSPDEQGAVAEPERKNKQGIEMTITNRTEKNGASWKIIELPSGISQKKFDEFCKGVVLGRSVARKEWTPIKRHFSRDQYDDVIAAMETADLVTKRQGEGAYISPNGKRAIAAYVRQMKKEGEYIS